MIIRAKLHNNAIEWLLLFVIMLFLIFGCDFAGGLKKEEKNIFGYVNGYNPRIKEIEQILKEKGYNPGSVDGALDKQTRAAIKDFQKKNKLKETGFIDAKTYAILESLKMERRKMEEEKARAEQVKFIKKTQQALKKAGFFSGQANGIMDNATRKAIIAFQKSKGLIQDGKVNQKTWGALKKYLPKK